MKKVLLVDNDITIRIIAKNAIEGHWESKVILAANGTEALRMAAKENPILIILDLIMPGIDGIGVLKKLREQGNETPVIFVTAKEEVNELEQYKAQGVISIIRKPFLPRTLLQECSKILGEN